MKNQSPEAAEQKFFTALIEADAGALAQLLADDFLLQRRRNEEVRRLRMFEVSK